jgi:hypothetical protein
MSEEEWLASKDVEVVARQVCLANSPSRRKARLLALAVARTAGVTGHLLTAAQRRSNFLTPKMGYGGLGFRPW